MHKLIMVAMVMGLGAPALADKAKDEAAIKALTASFAEAWNKHDAKALAALYTETGWIVDPFGTGKGRDGIEKEFSGLMNGPAKVSTTTLEVKDWELLKPDLAAVSLEQVVTNMMSPDGKAMPPVKFIVGCVDAKKGGKWLAHWCSVGTVPPAPPPQAAAAAPAKK